MKLTEHKYDFEKKIVPSLNAIKSFKIEKSYKAIVPGFPIDGIVHQIRNSLKFVSYKDRKKILIDLKMIYRPSNEKTARHTF